MKKRVKYVEDIMHEVVSIESYKTIKDAAELMTEKKIGSLIVKSEGKVSGIVTEKDIVESIALGKDPNIKVYEITVKKIHSIESGTEILNMGKLFDKYKVRRLPVKKDGEIIGITTIKDFVEAIPIVYSGVLSDIEKLVK